MEDDHGHDPGFSLNNLKTFRKQALGHFDALIAACTDASLEIDRIQKKIDSIERKRNKMVANLEEKKNKEIEAIEEQYKKKIEVVGVKIDQENRELAFKQKAISSSVFSNDKKEQKQDSLLEKRSALEHVMKMPPKKRFGIEGFDSGMPIAQKSSLEENSFQADSNHVFTLKKILFDNVKILDGKEADEVLLPFQQIFHWLERELKKEKLFETLTWISKCKHCELAQKEFLEKVMPRKARGKIWYKPFWLEGKYYAGLSYYGCTWNSHSRNQLAKTFEMRDRAFCDP